MKRMLAVFGVALVFCALALIAKPNPSSGNVEDQIVQTERAWLAAEASDDLPALRRIVADDFIGTAFGPNVLTKTDIVPPEGASSNRMPKSSLHESTKARATPAPPRAKSKDRMMGSPRIRGLS